MTKGLAVGEVKRVYESERLRIDAVGMADDEAALLFFEPATRAGLAPRTGAPQMVSPRWPKKPGRPALKAEVGWIIVRMATGYLRWGYGKIQEGWAR